MSRVMRTNLNKHHRGDALARAIIASALVDINMDDAVGVASITSVPNSGTGGPDFDPDFIVGNGANLKPHPSGSCLFYGGSGDFPSTPDSEAASITGDIDIRVEAAPDSWTGGGGGGSTLVGKWQSSSTISYALLITASDELALFISITGTGTIVYTSDASYSFTDGSRHWVRATLDVDNGAADSDATFYTSEDGETWVQLGSVINSGGTVSIDDNNSPVSIGALLNGVANRYTGDIYRVQIRNGIDGPLAVDFNPPDAENTGATAFNSDLMAANLPGSVGDYLSTPNAAANQITGDLDLRAEIEPADWTIQTTVISKDIGPQRGYRLNFRADGTLQVAVSASAGSLLFAESTVATGFTDGTRHWIRATVDVNNGAGGWDATFYTSEDGVTWTQLGDVVTTATPISITPATSALQVGGLANGGSQLVTGSIYSIQIYNGIDGVLAVDLNPQDYVTGATLTSSETSEVWTANGNAAFRGQWALNGNTFIQNTGHKVGHSIGGVGLETTAGQSITSPGTVFLVARSTPASPSAGQHFISYRSNISNLWVIQTQNSASDRFTMTQGSALTLDEAYDQLPHVFTAQFNGNSSSKLTASGVGNKSGDAGAASWDYGTLFADGAGASTMQGYIARIIVVDRELTAAEINAVKNLLIPEYRLVA